MPRLKGSCRIDTPEVPGFAPTVIPPAEAAEQDRVRAGSTWSPESSRDRPRWGSSTQRPDILERGPDGLYRYLVASEDMRQALFDYLACDRVAAAWARKRSAKDKDLARTRWLSP